MKIKALGTLATAAALAVVLLGMNVIEVNFGAGEGRGPVPGVDRRKPHKVFIAVGFSPDARQQIRWQIGPDGDVAEVSGSPWNRRGTATSGQEIHVYVITLEPSPGHALTCLVQVDGRQVDYDDNHTGPRNECNVSYTVP